MSKEQIGRLQGLLERVQSRAAESRSPRTNGNGNGSAAHVASASAAPAYGAAQAEAAISQAPVTPIAYTEQPSFPSSPPDDMSPAPATASESTSFDMESDGDVEVSSEVVEVDIDIDEPEPMESGAQPVAHPTMPPEELEEVIDDVPMATQPSHHSRGAPQMDQTQETSSDEELTALAPPANEIEEPTPSSSRRPIAEETQAETYEEGSAPRHTPPPESGKQVAAASAHPPSYKPSAPPPSLEGHTLIGGWREPGLGPQASPVAGGAGGSTGVRVPAPPAPPAGRAEDAAAFAAAAPAQASGTRLTPDVTKPALGAAGAVASFQGFAAIPKPTTLGELLDLTLGL